MEPNWSSSYELYAILMYANFIDLVLVFLHAFFNVFYAKMLALVCAVDFRVRFSEVNERGAPGGVAEIPCFL